MTDAPYIAYIEITLPYSTKTYTVQERAHTRYSKTPMGMHSIASCTVLLLVVLCLYLDLRVESDTSVGFLIGVSIGSQYMYGIYRMTVKYTLFFFVNLKNWS